MASKLIQLIDSEGVFSSTGADAALAAAGIAGDAPYQVVSVIGPQSSGKSTLLNALFGTNFREMVRSHVYISSSSWMEARFFFSTAYTQMLLQ